MAAYLAAGARRSKGKTVARRRRNPLEDFPDHLLIAEYRLTRKLIQELIEMLRPQMQPKSNRGAPSTVEQRILICLKVLASGSFQNCAKDYVNVSQPTVSLMLDKFLEALAQHAHEFIYMPHDPDPTTTIQDFYSIAGFPSVIGAIDGTHVAIIAPHENEHLYVCRKGYHSINIQAVCHADLIFRDVVARWPGSSHDSFILRQTPLHDRFERGEFGRAILLGDSGYPLKTWLMTPYVSPSNIKQLKYNAAHKKTRGVVERAFGVLKKRFRILDNTGGHLCYTPLKVCKIFVCCAILHNICRKNNVPLIEQGDVPPDGDCNEETVGATPPSNATEIRDAIASTIAEAVGRTGSS